MDAYAQTHTYAYKFTHTLVQYTRTSIYVSIKHTQVHMHMHKRTHYTYVNTHTHICTQTNSSTHTRISTDTHTHTHINTYMHTQTHNHLIHLPICPSLVISLTSYFSLWLFIGFFYSSYSSSLSIPTDLENVNLELTIKINSTSIQLWRQGELVRITVFFI